MHFFTSLIILVPLVFFVVALPASSQDASLIKSDISNILEQFILPLFNPDGYDYSDVPQAITQIQAGVTSLTSSFIQLGADLVADPSYFDEDDTQIFFTDLERLLSLLNQLQGDLTDAALDPTFKVGLAPTVKAFIDAVQEAVSAILEKYPIDWTVRATALGIAFNDPLVALRATYVVPPSR